MDPLSRLEELNKKWVELAPIVLDFAGTVADRDQKSVAKIIRRTYLETEDITEKNLPKLVDMFSDRLFDVGISLSARLHAEVLKSPVYLIHFTYRAIFGIQSFFAPNFEFKGAGHADDNMILYKTPLRSLPLTTDEELMVKLYAEFFVSYATQEKPEMAEVALVPITTKYMPFLHIKSPKNITIENTVGFANEKFWYSLPIAEYTKWNAPKKPQKIEL